MSGIQHRVLLFNLLKCHPEPFACHSPREAGTPLRDGVSGATLALHASAVRISYSLRTNSAKDLLTTMRDSLVVALRRHSLRVTFCLHHSIGEVLP